MGQQRYFLDAFRLWALPLLFGCGLGGAAQAQNATLNFYGAPGVIDMPSGQVRSDGDLSTTLSHFGGVTRAALSFQLAPRVSGSFRYTATSPSTHAGTNANGVYFDRSFDVRYQILHEGRYLPDLAIGLQDFAGTGLYSGEYIAATKHFTPSVRGTLGLGWGRLASYGAIGSIGTRDTTTASTGGQFNAGQWFQGDVAPFGGLEWDVNERWTLGLEYSSDAYTQETGDGAVRRSSPLNFGATYRLNDRWQIAGAVMHGDTVGISLTNIINPKHAVTPMQIPALPPVAQRPSPTVNPAIWSTDWAQDTTAPAQILAALTPSFQVEGIRIEALSVTAAQAEIWISTQRFRSWPNTIGRTARMMASVLPASVELFRIVPVEGDLPLSAVEIRRSDLEALEFDPQAAQALQAVTGIGETGGLPTGALRVPVQPRFTWSIGPYSRSSYFDPDQPLRMDFGVRAKAAYHLAPGLTLSGSLRKRAFGNIGSGRASNSVLPHVRTDGNLYAQQENVALEKATLNYNFRPGDKLYGRVTLGYLESMYGGLSTEVLWKPVNRRWALGAELNYAVQRDFDMGLGFQSYSIVTGHGSMYYDFGRGYLGQVDIGRYLAGDLGGTVTMRRVFDNGWELGGFFTLTDVSAADFGEGSFDKGITLKIPLAWMLGKPTRRSVGTVIRPIQRDGGARLSVDGRLYNTVRSAHSAELAAEWGRVWK
jgi:hypothetical protein